MAYLKDIYGEIPEWVQKMNDYHPKVLEYYTNLWNEVMKEENISKKEKELILVGINAARRYEKDLLNHAKRAINLGANV
ncbi:carboxymuconolactone decarboxylase family protein [Virgibacillus sp. NKC19-3]|uniref:carboxymuconolactone decarboxylase family protein n=1 Tax=Virgibacillus saliphilus TaxID=2831674 RepID=UPI001C9B3D69|nr:carboxymuconolactone decarboxylase family protein [Virgibacillus sp. NKC19-3]MBY7144535.1 carboxymuconolactone decarboxylase family protein [Virgibacillus sp. NKC19-3]